MTAVLPRGCLLVIAALALAPARVLAHQGVAPAPHDLWQSWSAEPLVIALLLLGAILHVRGTRAVWRRAGAGHGVPRWRAWCFAAGLGAVALALVSPIDRIGSALFAAHMVQHLLLVMVAAPLLVLGEPVLAFLWALPLPWRRAIWRGWRASASLRWVWRAVRRPPVAWVLHVLALWAWHVPAMYDAALRRGALHALEHSSFVLTALLYWYTILDRRAARRTGVGAIVVSLFAAALQSTILGAAITLARRPWYTAHWGTTTPWGLTPLEDQQVAGLLMWVPAGIVYLVVLAPLVMRMLRGQRDEQRSRPVSG